MKISPTLECDCGGGCLTQMLEISHYDDDGTPQGTWKTVPTRVLAEAYDPSQFQPKEEQEPMEKEQEDKDKKSRCAIA